jgi:phosphocarrier protein HPr
LTQDAQQAVREAAVPNREGMHARPVMKFVDLASTFQASVMVSNITRDASEVVDGKSAMQLMLLEACQGSVLRIEAEGADAVEAVDALEDLVRQAFHMDTNAPDVAGS